MSLDFPQAQEEEPLEVRLKDNALKLHSLSPAILLSMLVLMACNDSDPATEEAIHLKLATVSGALGDKAWDDYNAQQNPEAFREPLLRVMDNFGDALSHGNCFDNPLPREPSEDCPEFQQKHEAAKRELRIRLQSEVDALLRRIDAEKDESALPSLYEDLDKLYGEQSNFRLGFEDGLRNELLKNRAELLEQKLKNYLKAAEIYDEIDDRAGMMRCYSLYLEKQSDPNVARNYAAELVDDGKKVEAADILFKYELYEEALRLYYSAGTETKEILEKRITAHLKLGDTMTAINILHGELFDFKRAASLELKLGDRNRAAKNFLLAGSFEDFDKCMTMWMEQTDDGLAEKNVDFAKAKAAERRAWVYDKKAADLERKNNDALFSDWLKENAELWFKGGLVDLQLNDLLELRELIQHSDKYRSWYSNESSHYDRISDAISIKILSKEVAGDDEDNVVERDLRAAEYCADENQRSKIVKRALQWSLANPDDKNANESLSAHVSSFFYYGRDNKEMQKLLLQVADNLMAHGYLDAAITIYRYRHPEGHEELIKRYEQYELYSQKANMLQSLEHTTL